jgi:excisionase family DNA binding protein
MAKNIIKLHEAARLQTCIDSIADSVKALSNQCVELSRRIQETMPNVKQPPKLLQIKEVAALLSISRPMVYKLIYEGSLEAFNLGKRCLRISELSVIGLLAENKILPLDMGIAFDSKELVPGDLIVISEDSVEFNELAGESLAITRVVSAGVFAKEVMAQGNGFFVPFRDFDIKKDISCEVHGI